MANVIKHKRGSGSDPVASDLVVGEVAIRTDVGKLFTKMDNGSVAEIAGGGSDIAINTLSSSSGTGGGSATFNGSAYRFTLSAPPSVSAQQLLVSINGVIQKPVAGTGQPSEGFSVDGTDIILGDAPATGSDFFILTFKSLGVSEPADNSVTSAKIVDGAIVNADINASAAIDVSKLSGVLPLAGGTLTGNTTISSSGNPTFSIISTTQGGVPKIQLRDGYSRNNFISIDDNGDNLIIAVDEDSNGHASTIRHRIDGVEVSRITRTQNTSTITHALVGNVDISSGLDVTGAITGTGDMTIDTNTLHVDSSNNRVGIGTTNPNHMLDISGSNPILALNDTDTTNDRFRLTYNGGSTQLQVDPNNVRSGSHLLVAVDGSERMRIDSSGNVGIGTLTPAGKLHISSGTSGDCKLIIEADTDNNDENDNPLIIFRQDGGLEESAIGMGFTSTASDNLLTIANSVTNGGISFATGTTNGYTNAVERVRIDTSGNVGIGTSSPNAPLVVRDASSPHTVFRVNSQSERTKAFIQTVQDSDLRIGSESNHPLNLYTNGNARLHISNAGAVGIGTTSPGHLLHLQKAMSSSPNLIEISTSGTNTVGGGGGISFDCSASSTSATKHRAQIHGVRNSLDNASNDLVFLTSTNGVNNDNPTEKVRIKNDGKVGIGTTSPSSKLHVDNGGSGNVAFLKHASSGIAVTLTLQNNRATGSIAGEQISFLDDSGTQRGKITNTTSSTTYATSSDYRLKENEVLISDGIERIKKFKPYKFNWKHLPNKTVDGFFAHEVENLVEDCVDGTKDRVVTKDDHDKGDYLDKEIGTEIHQMMDHSKLVPLLVAALQEAIGRIEALEAK